MKVLIFLVIGFLCLSVSVADLQHPDSFILLPANPSELTQCAPVLQYLSQSQLQYMKDVQDRLKQQRSSMQQSQAVLTLIAQKLKNPEISAQLQKNPKQASQIFAQIKKEAEQELQNRSRLAQIRENMPEDELTDIFSNC
ncbi:uncharacterized protein LOC123320136 [Coccinella septempunctata]|uniref:uncharacterized protein LOC123320136 n=1 Tax=Coccinella septempunctata TaxID=41139 RepID=UPI001D061F4D|nr:uncharacterized protein LOC123320136 [Coccinella septempunctata]